MPWMYSNIKPPVMPDCAWCHKVDGVVPYGGKRDTYSCRGCGAQFEARFERAPDAPQEDR